MRRKLADRGWLTMGWPKEYGGQDASPITQLVFNEEMAYYRAPGKDAFGIGMLGPALMMHGTEEQKRKYLPAIAEGRINWCQGFSEPGSGSDLASLQTRAVEDGDDFVISRPEDLDQRRSPCRPILHARPHQPRGPQAPRHHLLSR